MHFADIWGPRSDELTRLSDGRYDSFLVRVSAGNERQDVNGQAINTDTRETADFTGFSGLVALMLDCLKMERDVEPQLRRTV